MAHVMKDVPFYYQIGQWPSVEMAIDYLAWGFFMGIFRFLRCNPFSKGGYDPVK